MLPNGLSDLTSGDMKPHALVALGKMLDEKR
jgi:hypothetical protein